EGGGGGGVGREGKGEGALGDRSDGRGEPGDGRGDPGGSASTAARRERTHRFSSAEDRGGAGFRAKPSDPGTRRSRGRFRPRRPGSPQEQSAFGRSALPEAHDGGNDSGGTGSRPGDGLLRPCRGPPLRLPADPVPAFARASCRPSQPASEPRGE